MHLEFTLQEWAFREEVRSFLREHLPQDLRDKVRGGCRSRATSTCVAALPARAWLGRDGWPKEFGGAGWNAVQQYIFEEEAAMADAPRILPFGVKMVAPVLIAFGSAAQQRRFLPPISAGEAWWCQGYSEPGSGSDLASLRTRAVREGDHYVVNGQKTWNTLGQYADWIFCLVRTDTEAKAQSGITLPAHRHEEPGHQRAPDPAARRRTRGQRDLVRERACAGRRTVSARKTGAGPMPSSCSDTSARASRASA